MLAIAAWAFLAPAGYAETATAPKKIAAVEGVTEYRFDNGLRLLLYPDPAAAKLTVHMTVLVGSRHEGYGEAGMAHLLEHMLFKGTPTHADIWKALRDQGAEFSTDSTNAITEADRTYYFETLPASDANLEFAIRLEADRLVNSFVRRDDLITEMTVVRNEFEQMENNPITVLAHRIHATGYDWHNYGKTPFGNRSDIERVPIDRLQAFYRKYYQPDNVVLVITGKFDEGKALDLVAKSFGVLKRPARRLETTYTEEPAQDGERTVVLRRVGSVGAVAVGYHVPGSRHEDFAAVQVLASVLKARLLGPLVGSGKGTDLVVSADKQHDAGVVYCGVKVDAQKPLEEARDVLIRVVEGVSSTPVPEEELQRVKRAFTIQIETVLANSKQMAKELSAASACGDWRLFFLNRDRLATVTAADVTRVAGLYLRRNNRTLGMYFPTKQAERVAIPVAPAAAELVNDYRGKTAATTVESFEPTPENLEKRVQRSQLPGGIKVALLPKPTLGQKVWAQLVLRYGNEHSLKDNVEAARLIGTLLLGGTKDRNRGQLVEQLDELAAGFEIVGKPGALTITVVAKRDSFPQALRLLGEVLRAPAFPEHELEILKRKRKQELEQQRSEPTTLALNALARKLSPYPKSDSRYVPALEEQIADLDALTIDRVRRLHAEQVGGQVGEFAAVGDFDPAATHQALAEILKDWKAAVTYKPLPGPDRTEVPSSRQDIVTPDKSNAIFTAGHLVPAHPEHPDYLALQLANHILGADPGSRLFERVRTKEGLSYTVQSALVASEDQTVTGLKLAAICNPRNIDKVERALTQELAKLVNDGVTAEELAAAKKAIHERGVLDRSDNRYLATLLTGDLRAGRTFSYDVERVRKRAGLTVADVNQAIRRHFVPDRLVIVRAGDFKAE